MVGQHSIVCSHDNLKSSTKKRPKSRPLLIDSICRLFVNSVCFVGIVGVICLTINYFVSPYSVVHSLALLQAFLVVHVEFLSLAHELVSAVGLG